MSTWQKKIFETIFTWITSKAWTNSWLSVHCFILEYNLISCYNIYHFQHHERLMKLLVIIVTKKGIISRWKLKLNTALFGMINSVPPFHYLFHANRKHQKRLTRYTSQQKFVYSEFKWMPIISHYNLYRQVIPQKNRLNWKRRMDKVWAVRKT